MSDFTLHIDVKPIDIRLRMLSEDLSDNALRLITKQFFQLKELIMASNAELTARLEALATRAEKVKAEVTKAIQDLRDVIAAGGETSPEVEAALVKAETAVGGIDELNPDATP